MDGLQTKLDNVLALITTQRTSLSEEIGALRRQCEDLGREITTLRTALHTATSQDNQMLVAVSELQIGRAHV